MKDTRASEKVKLYSTDDYLFNHLRASPTKWAHTFKKFVSFCRKIVLSLFDHFVGLALKGLKVLTNMKKKENNTLVLTHFRLMLHFYTPSYLYTEADLGLLQHPRWSAL